MENLIKEVIRIAFILVALGQLKPATLYLLSEVAKSQQNGLVSLSKLNRALFQSPEKN